MVRSQCCFQFSNEWSVLTHAPDSYPLEMSSPRLETPSLSRATNADQALGYTSLSQYYSTAPVVFHRPTQASGEGFLAHRNPTRCSLQVPTAGRIFPAVIPLQPHRGSTFLPV